MLNTEKITQELTIDQAIAPIVHSGINFREQRRLLHKMFTMSVANAPDNEVDNFTAQRLSPFYLAMCELLENLDSIDEIHGNNVIFCIDNLAKH